MKKSIRRTPLVLAALWIGVASYYWRTSVLLPPECIFQFPEGRGFGGLAPNGDVMLLTKVREGTSGQDRLIGPIEFWRLPEIKKVREAFTVRDQIGWPRPDSLGRIVFVREGKGWLADINKGELLEELPGIETRRSSRMLLNDRVITCSEDTVSIYDLTSKRELASYDGWVWAEPIDGILWSIYPKTGSRPAFAERKEMMVVDIVRGQIDYRFRAVGPFNSIVASPDGKTLVVSQDSTSAVCDVSSGKRLWSLPKVEAGSLRFEPDSTVLAADVLDERKQVRTARWRVADGSVIDPLPRRTLGQSAGSLTRHMDRKGRYSLDHKLFKTGVVSYWLNQAVFQMSRWIGTKNSSWPPDWQRSGEVRDVIADEVIGVYSVEPWDDLVAPDGSGFVSFTTEDYENNRLRYYRLPPRRDWDWLVRWGMLPAGVLLAMQLLLWTLERQKRPATQPVRSLG